MAFCGWHECVFLFLAIFTQTPQLSPLLLILQRVAGTFPYVSETLSDTGPTRTKLSLVFANSARKPFAAIMTKQ